MSKIVKPCDSNPELWFSENPADMETAADKCFDCPLMLTCGDKGLTEEHGVWGGILPTDPRRMEYAAQQRIVEAQQDKAERESAMWAMHRDGKSTREIGAALSVSHMTVSRYLRAA